MNPLFEYSIQNSSMTFPQIAGTLTIRNANEMDQGTYVCMAKDPYGRKVEAQAKLMVRRGSQAGVDVVVTPSYTEIPDGGNVYLFCNTSSPGRDITWSFNRGALPAGVEPVSLPFQSRQFDTQLTLPSAFLSFS